MHIQPSGEFYLDTAAVATNDPRWLRLVGVLAKNRPAIVADYLDLLSGMTYAAGIVDTADVRDSAHEAFVALIDRLVPTRLAEASVVAERLGQRRARQQVPLDDLLAAIRLDFGVLWGVLRRLADADDQEVLLDHAHRVHDAVERHVADVQRAYLSEQVRLRSDRQAYEAQILARLFEAKTRGGMSLAQIATELGVRVEDTFTVVAVPRHTERTPEFTRLLVAGAHAYRFADDIVVFRAESRGQWPVNALELPGGVIRAVAGLEAVVAAGKSARALAAVALPGEGLVSPEQAWMRLANGSVRQLVPELFAAIERALVAVESDERERVLDTVEAFARTGSVKTTSELMFCHRNTVVNRLQSFREWVGLDVTVPEQAALILVAISAIPRG